MNRLLLTTWRSILMFAIPLIVTIIFITSLIARMAAREEYDKAQHPTLNPMFEYRGEGVNEMTLTISAKPIGRTNILYTQTFSNLNYIYLGMSK